MQISPQPISPTTVTESARLQRLKGWAYSQTERALKPAVLRGVLSLVDQAIVSGSNFATSVIIGRMCSQNEMGVYYLALSIAYFSRGIQEQITSVPYMVYRHRKEDGELAAYSGSTLFHQMMFALVVVSSLAVFGIAIDAGWGPASLQTTVWVLMGALPLMLLREYLRQLCFAHFRMLTAMALDAAVATLQVGGLLWIGLRGGLTIPIVYCVMGGACALTAGVWFFKFKNEIRFRRSQFWTDWKENWIFARWTVASQLVGSSTPYILPWFVVTALGAAETGLLAASNTLVGLANMFVMGIANYLTPQAAQAFAEGGAAALKRVMLYISLLFTGVLGSFFLVVLLWGDALLAFVYGSGYAAAGPIVAVLAAGLWTTSLALTAGNGLCAMNRPAANFRADLCSLVTTIIASALLIPGFGALGAAWSALIGTSVDALLRFVTLGHCLKEAGPLPTAPNDHQREGNLQ